MSSSLVHAFYTKQKKLMQELKLDFLDFYEATYVSAAWTMHGDGRHYRQWLNKKLIDFSYAS
jgi:hypothetical protein